MFKTRLISGILLVIAALLTIISGGYVLFFTLLCISLIGMQELYKAMGVHGESTGLLEIIGYLGAILYYVSLLLEFESYGLMTVLVSLILLMFVYVFTYPKYNAHQIMSAFFGVVYVAVSYCLFIKNVTETVRRFRNHPSIALWSARNEGFAPNELENMLATTLAKEDGSRHYAGNSRSVNSSGSGPWRYQFDAVYP